jgi:soluble lytic murein transglycosylase
MSRAGAVGLMQIMPATAERIGRAAGVPDAAARLEDPGSNITLGAYYLGWLLSRYEGRVALALAAYNAGEDAVDRWRGEMPAAILSEEDAFIEEISYRETRNYVKKVLKSYNIYLRLYSSSPSPAFASGEGGG